MTAKHGLDVDRRVRIALNALSAAERDGIERIIGSAEAFEQACAQPGRVRVLAGTEPRTGATLRMVRATPTLRLVFTRDDEMTRIVDLVDRATLRHFAPEDPATMPEIGHSGHVVES